MAGPGEAAYCGMPSRYDSKSGTAAYDCARRADAIEARRRVAFQHGRYYSPRIAAFDKRYAPSCVVSHYDYPIVGRPWAHMQPAGRTLVLRSSAGVLERVH